MEVMKSFGTDLGFLQKNMSSSLPEPVVFETLSAAQRSLACLLMMIDICRKLSRTKAKILHYHMTQFVLKDAEILPKLTGNDQRFPFAELHRRDKTEPEAQDGSDTEDDDEDDADAEEPEDDDAGDEDFSGEEGGEDDDEEGDPDEEDPEANGNKGSDDDDDDDDDDEEDNDDDEDDDEEEEEDDDEEEQPPAKKRK